VLIVGRAFQGMGMALMPLTMAVAREHLPPHRVSRVIGALSVSTAAGIGLGHPITGLVAEHTDIVTAFWGGAAVSAIALVLALLVIPSPPPSTRRRRLDLTGAAVIGAALLGLLFALEQAPDWGWLSPRILPISGATIGLFALWIRHELRTVDPLVELRRVRHRAVLTANVAGIALSMMMYGVVVLLTQFVQQPGYGLGESIFVGGLALVPMSVLSTSTSRMLTVLMRRVGSRPIIPAGSLAVALCCVAFAATTGTLWPIFVASGLLGLGVGLTYAAMPGLIVGAVPPGETGSALGFYQVSRFVGFSSARRSRSPCCAASGTPARRLCTPTRTPPSSSPGSRCSRRCSPGSSRGRRRAGGLDTPRVPARRARRRLSRPGR